jgi:hypothetical protein
MVDEHDKHPAPDGGHCHSNSEVREQHCVKRKDSYVVGIVASILACACCYVPVIALTVGVSIGRGLGFLDEYHVFLDSIGIAFMIGASIYIWRQHKRADLPIFRDKHFWLPLFCMLVMYGVMSLGIRQWVLPLLNHGEAEHHHVH